jgi:hypothetical protein
MSSTGTAPPYWVVISMDNPSSCHYASEQEARQYAAQNASKNPGTRYMVFRAVAAYTANLLQETVYL